MSYQAVRAVLENSTLRGSSRLALLIVAEHADDQGIAWPSYETIAAEAAITPRQAIRAIQTAEAAGELAIVPGGGRGRSNRYHIITVNRDMGVTVSPPETVTSPPINSDTGVTVFKPETVTSATETVTSAPINSDTHVTRTIMEPSEPPADLLLAQNRSALEARGVGEPKRSELADLAGMTPALIDQTPGAPGLLVTRLPELAAAAVAERSRRAARERERAERAERDEAARDEIAAERAAVAAWLAGLDDQAQERWRAAAIAGAPRAICRGWARANLAEPGGWPLKTAMHRAARAEGDTETTSKNGDKHHERNGTRAGGGIGSNEKYRGLLSQSPGRGG